MSSAVLPRPALIAAGLAVGLSLAAAGLGRLAPPAAPPEAFARALASRDLIFADRPDGGVAVTDAAAGQSVAILPAGSNSFLRALMRVLAHQRIRHDGAPDTPFRLTAWSDGRLTLADPATGRSVGLEAFGIDNETVFARLLGPEATP